MNIKIKASWYLLFILWLLFYAAGNVFDDYTGGLGDLGAVFHIIGFICFIFGVIESIRALKRRFGKTKAAADHPQQ